MLWSPQQDAALSAVSRWLKAGGRQVFRLFGYAGTGKTTLARHLAETVAGEVAFAAFTGKAAHVMRGKGCRGAGTIHSLIYRTRGEDENGPTFVLNHDSAAGKAELIIIDECSMVDEEIGRDLLSFGTPVLVLGDPAQLPPIAGGGFFTEAEPDIMLTEVHRQAADNPIVRLSMIAREGGRLEEGRYGDSRVVDRDAIDQEEVLAADQVLVGRNLTRRNYNARIRELLGRESPVPVSRRHAGLPQERPQARPAQRQPVACRSRAQAAQGPAALHALARRGRGRQGAHRGFHQSRLLRRHRRRPVACPSAAAPTSSTSATCSPSTRRKGSQWDAVMLFDESFAFRENRARWLYTGITRAAEKLTVVLLTVGSGLRADRSAGPAAEAGDPGGMAAASTTAGRAGRTSRQSGSSRPA